MIEKQHNNKDTKLVIAYQSGHKKAFAALVKRWHLQFCKFAYCYVKDADIAKDIAQECWTIIYKKLDTLHQPEKFKSWAISIVNRRAIDWIRASNRERHKLHLLYEEAPKVSSILEENTDQQEKKIRLKAAIEKLTVQQKTIIDLFYTQEYSLNEISELLHISVGTAKSRLFHAREKLKSILKK